MLLTTIQYLLKKIIKINKNKYITNIKKFQIYVLEYNLVPVKTIG